MYGKSVKAATSGNGYVEKRERVFYVKPAFHGACFSRAAFSRAALPLRNTLHGKRRDIINVCS